MSGLTFPKSRRLLVPAEFKAVFDENRCRVSLPYLLILAKPNTHGHPRLGLVISRKHAKRALDRNRIKRAVRESFRATQQHLSAMDIIVLGRTGVHQQAVPDLLLAMENGWVQLTEKIARVRT